MTTEYRFMNLFSDGRKTLYLTAEGAKRDADSFLAGSISNAWVRTFRAFEDHVQHREVLTREIEGD